LFPKLQALLVIKGGENLTPNPVSFITNSVCNLGKPNTFGVLERVRLTTYGCLPKVSWKTLLQFSLKP